MTLQEFSDQFDVLYNNVMSNAAPGLNEYEKSVFLTKAQEEILKNYFNPKGNKYQEGFDDSAKRQIDFSSLITVDQYTQEEVNDDTLKFDPRGKLFNLNSEVFLIINESVSLTLEGRTGLRQVVPLKFDEYLRLMSKPYKEPLKYQAWRLVSEGSAEQIIRVEVILNSNDLNNFSSYNVRYLRRPRPIILVNLQNNEYEGVSINGKSEASECELNPIIHEEILQRGVELAKIAYTGDAQGLITAGQRSE